MTSKTTVFRSAALAAGIVAAGAMSALAIHAGMSNGDGAVSFSAKGSAPITHAPQLATMQLGKTVVDQMPALVTTTTTAPGH